MKTTKSTGHHSTKIYTIQTHNCKERERGGEEKYNTGWIIDYIVRA